MRPLDTQITGLAHHCSCGSAHPSPHLHFSNLLHQKLIFCSWCRSHHPSSFYPVLSGQGDGNVRTTLQRKACTLARNQQVRKRRQPSSTREKTSKARSLLNNEKTQSCLQNAVRQAHTTLHLAADHPASTVILRSAKSDKRSPLQIAVWLTESL